jgi:hypothetical protein
MIGRSADSGRRKLAVSLVRAAYTSVDDFTSPRAWAYALLGFEEYLRVVEDAPVQAARDRVAHRLLALHQHTSSARWPWFEDKATYCNARLSQAMLASGFRMQHDEMIAAGLRSLEWLAEIQRAPEGDHFSPIGSHGFYARNGTKAAYDQQPVEAAAMVSACLVAARITEDARWAVEARRAFDWFLGKNVLGQSLYDPATGGCRDGLHEDRLNENQGAESTLSFLTALFEMRVATNVVGSQDTA